MMSLAQLREAVEVAIERADESGEDPDQIVVSLQIDNEDGDSIWSSRDVELHYDNNGQASGCVLTAFKTNHGDG